MAKYIDAEAVKSLIMNEWGYEGLEEQLEAIPAADVEPVRHGRWVGQDLGFATCSLCGGVQEVDFAPDRYCPNCGAKMDGGGTDGNQGH